MIFGRYQTGHSKFTASCLCSGKTVDVSVQTTAMKTETFSAVETVSEGLCEFRSAMQILNIIKLLFVSLSLAVQTVCTCPPSSTEINSVLLISCINCRMHKDRHIEEIRRGVAKLQGAN